MVGRYYATQAGGGPPYRGGAVGPSTAFTYRAGGRCISLPIGAGRWNSLQWCARCGAFALPVRSFSGEHLALELCPTACRYLPLGISTTFTRCCHTFFLCRVIVVSSLPGLPVHLPRAIILYGEQFPPAGIEHLLYYL